MADNKQLMFSVQVEAEQAIKDLAIYNRNIQNIDKSIEELRKQQKAEGADVQELEQRIVRMQQARKTYQKAIAESSKELQNSIKVNTLAEGSLAGLRAELSKLNAQYDNLSRADREGDIGKGLQENINKVTKEIKDAEFATQRFYRNVGNYPNQLSFSVQQVARELPSLANGAQTFFIAISNNLPMLADQIKAAHVEYKAAVASGEAATPVWKQLLSSIESWQTLLTGGIALLTVYGKDIVEFVGGLFKQKEAFDASAKAAEDYNKTMTEARTQGAKDVAQLQTLYGVATDVKRSIDLRREAVALLRREYPAYLQHLSDEEIMAGKAAGAYKLLRDQMLEMAKTRAIMDRLTELNAAQVSAEYEAIREAEIKVIEAQKELQEFEASAIKQYGENFKFANQAQQAMLNSTYAELTATYRNALKQLEEAGGKFEETFKIPAKNVGDINDYVLSATGKLINGITTFRTELDKVTAPDGGTVKVLELDIEHLYDDINAVNAELDSIIAKQQAQAKALTQAIALATKGLANPFTALEEEYAQALETIRQDTTLANDERVFYELALEVQLAKRKQELTEQLNRQQYEARVAQANKELQMAWRDADAQYKIKRDFLQKELQDARNSAEQRARLEQELAELNSQYAQQKIDNFSKYAQQVVQLATSISDVFKANEDAQLQKAEATNEAEKKSLKQKLDSGLISQKRYDREIARMDAELDAKKAKIAYNQAMREKALSVAQIAINTATAIAKIWAEVPKADFGATTIALTAMAAAMGVAQTAAVLATPIPKARKGGIVAGATHEQGGVLINTEDKERIISAKPAQAFPELLNLISYIGKHSSIPDTGFAARTLVSGSASSAPINADELAQKIGAQVGEAVRQMPIYLSLTELKEAQEEYARIEQSAKS
jgi:hypothetical protein